MLGFMSNLQSSRYQSQTQVIQVEVLAEMIARAYVLIGLYCRWLQRRLDIVVGAMSLALASVEVSCCPSRCSESTALEDPAS